VKLKPDPYQERLSDWIDDELDPSERKELDDHLESCADCRDLVSELRTLRREARSLSSVEPPAHLWTAIATELKKTERVKTRRSQSSSLLALAAAVVLGAGLWITVRQEAPANDGQRAIADRVTAELEAAETHYENAIDGLEQIMSQNDGTLPEELQQTMSDNLDLIERTIVESREAMVAEPDSAVAQESLLEAFRRKVDLLQNTILLINEVRKGEGENALELIDEIQRSEDPSNPI